MLLERCAEVGALVQREGIEFGVLDRQLAVGGQLIRLNGAEGPVDDVFLPLHGAHQAANAAQALAAVEAFLGLKALNPDVVREGFAQVRFPGRLELVRRSPTVVLDAAHNPHGARAAAAAVTEAFGFTPLVGVVAVMADKDAEGLLRVFEEIMHQVVITQVASTTRRDAGRASWASWPRRSSAPTGCTSPRGWTTPSSGPSPWPRPTASAPRACWSPGRWCGRRGADPAGQPRAGARPAPTTTPTTTGTPTTPTTATASDSRGVRRRPAVMTPC